jgi:hypothetical protein
MEENTLYPTVGWRTYLDPTKNKRVRRFIKFNGIEVFTNLYKSIDAALDDGATEILILVHPNVSSIVSIPEKQYTEVLNHCIDFFKSIQGYESCAEIVKIIKRISPEKQIS